jgi:hypothetical protein
MLTSILLLFCGLFSITAPADTTVNNEWKVLDRGHYSISYPANWTVDVSGNSGMDFIISSPFTDEEDIYNDFINLTIIPMKGLNKTLDSYAKEVSNDIPFFYQKAIIAENKKDKKGNRECYTLTYAGLMAEFPLAIRQYIWFENENSYSLTFTAEQKSFEEWDSIAHQIMDSFSFKN